ncbi:MAG: SDR family oxidoreductase [Myxococcota bacterium]
MGTRTLLVAGANGYLGRHVVKVASAQGWRVRALVRGGAERLGDVRPLVAEVHAGEATRPETLAGLCHGVDAVFSSLGKHDFKRRPTAWDVDYAANANILRRAVEARVAHVVFVSVIQGRELRERGVSSAAAREKVVDELVASGLGYTVLRPTGFFNDMEDFFRMARDGTAWLVGSGHSRMNPIHGADLAEEAVRCLEAGPGGQQLDVGGPDILSWEEMAQAAFRALGRAPRVRRVPAGVVSALAPLVGVVNPFVADLMRAIAQMGQRDVVGRAVGTHHLEEHYRQLAGGSAPP